MQKQCQPILVEYFDKVGVNQIYNCEVHDVDLENNYISYHIGNKLSNLTLTYDKLIIGTGN